jgi:hypothetical protein
MAIALSLAHVVAELVDPYTALLMHQLRGQQAFLCFFHEIQLHSD